MNREVCFYTYCLNITPSLFFAGVRLDRVRGGRQKYKRSPEQPQVAITQSPPVKKQCIESKLWTFNTGPKLSLPCMPCKYTLLCWRLWSTLRDIFAKGKSQWFRLNFSWFCICARILHFLPKVAKIIKLSSPFFFGKVWYFCGLNVYESIAQWVMPLRNWAGRQWVDGKH